MGTGAVKDRGYNAYLNILRINILNTSPHIYAMEKYDYWNVLPKGQLKGE